MKTIASFFMLAGACKWPGQLWTRQHPEKGYKKPWILQYEGAHVDDYFALLTRPENDWEEVISIEGAIPLIKQASPVWVLKGGAF